MKIQSLLDELKRKAGVAYRKGPDYAITLEHDTILTLVEALEDAKEALKFYALLEFKPTHVCDMDVRFQIDGGDNARTLLKKWEKV